MVSACRAEPATTSQALVKPAAHPFLLWWSAMTSSVLELLRQQHAIPPPPQETTTEPLVPHGDPNSDINTIASLDAIQVDAAEGPFSNIDSAPYE